MKNTVSIVLTTLALGLLLNVLALAKQGKHLVQLVTYQLVTYQPKALAAGNSMSTAWWKDPSEELWEKALAAGRMERQVVAYGNLLANMTGIATRGSYACAVASGLLAVNQEKSSAYF